MNATRGGSLGSIHAETVVATEAMKAVASQQGTKAPVYVSQRAAHSEQKAVEEAKPTVIASVTGGSRGTASPQGGRPKVFSHGQLTALAVPREG